MRSGLVRRAIRSGWLVWLVACGRPALSFAPEHLPAAKVGQPYHVAIEISGGKTPVGGVSTTSLPPGLTLTYDEKKQNETASIDGTPTAAGHASFTIDAWCYGTSRTGQTGEHTYELVIE